MHSRVILTVSGKDHLRYLQGMVSNDLHPLEHGRGIVWTALLSPQGKYLADFFVIRPETPDHVLIDISASLADATLARLNMYRLRADVIISPSKLHVTRGVSLPPENAFLDPRHPAMGWRLYTENQMDAPYVDWDSLRVRHCIPESGIELIPNETYILEAGFERLNGVDFRKGCYVGQEVTARMKHKTELRKGLMSVDIDGAAPIGSAITDGDGKVIGTLFSQSNGKAIAHLRHDKAAGTLLAGNARLNNATVTVF